MNYGSEQRAATLIGRVQELEKKVEELQARETNLTRRMTEVEAEVLRPDRPDETPPMP